MIGIALAALLLAGTGGDAGSTLEHHVRLGHASGATDVRYRGAVDVRYRQLGAAGAPGRPSSLRCAWQAKLTVDRHARHASGKVMIRSMMEETPVGGSRHGWCETQRASVRQELAARQAELHDRLVALAQEDHSALHAELDRAHGRAQTG